jgi:hypothetical protein
MTRSDGLGPGRAKATQLPGRQQPSADLHTLHETRGMSNQLHPVLAIYRATLLLDRIVSALLSAFDPDADISSGGQHANSAAAAACAVDFKALVTGCWTPSRRWCILRASLGAGQGPEMLDPTSFHFPPLALSPRPSSRVWS